MNFMVWSLLQVTGYHAALQEISSLCGTWSFLTVYTKAHHHHHHTLFL